MVAPDLLTTTTATSSIFAISSFTKFSTSAYSRESGASRKNAFLSKFVLWRVRAFHTALLAKSDPPMPIKNMYLDFLNFRARSMGVL